MKTITNAIQLFKKKGLFEFFRRSLGFAYRKSFRQYLPTVGYRTANGIKINERTYLFDSILLARKLNRPEQEDGIVSSHKEVTRSGDSVVVIGGGNGVTAVRAANMVGESGEVTIFEGGKKSVEGLEEVININGVTDRCEAYHAVVGPEKDVYGGESAMADTVQPDEIPDCDVLELDCEGAEIDICQELSIRPRAIIAELHPWNFQQDPDAMLEILTELGYEVTHRFGHDGTHLSKKEFETLLSNSNTQGERYVKSGGRWPVVVAASLSKA